MKNDANKAHAHSSNHRNEILESNICGCFYCKKTFKPSQITEWIDEDSYSLGQTALCPFCGIDSVIGDKSNYEINDDLLSRMNKIWFQ